MADMNSINLIGRVTRDAELRTVGQNSSKVANFGVANNTGFGQYAKTNFFDCQVWGKQAEGLTPYLKKGKQIAVTGTLESNNWTDRNGVERQGWRINVSNITLLADPMNAGGVKESSEEWAERKIQERLDTEQQGELVF